MKMSIKKRRNQRELISAQDANASAHRVRIKNNTFRQKNQGGKKDAGCWVLCAAKEQGKGTAFSKAVSTVWLSRCDRPYLSGRIFRAVEERRI